MRDDVHEAIVAAAMLLALPAYDWLKSLLHEDHKVSQRANNSSARPYKGLPPYDNQVSASVAQGHNHVYHRSGGGVQRCWCGVAK